MFMSHKKNSNQENPQANKVRAVRERCKQTRGKNRVVCSGMSKRRLADAVCPRARPKKAKEARDSGERESHQHEDGAEKLLMMMALRATGVLAGTQLIGHRPRTRDCIITLDRDLGPLASDIATLKSQGHFPLFVAKCLQLPGFKERFSTAEEMATWLETHADEANATFLGDGTNEAEIKVKVLRVGSGQFLDMEEQNGSGTLLGNEDGFTPSELENLLERPDKTRAGKRHTLVMHKGGFCHYVLPSQTELRSRMATCSVLLNLETGEEVSKKDISTYAHKKFTLVGPKSDVGVFYECAGQERPVFPDRHLGVVGKLIAKMTSGELKSLLQKLIRYASQRVVCGEESYPTAEVLQCVMETALLHKGGFVPQIQTVVPGLVSLFKRLAVTIVEDAWVGDASGDVLHDLMLAAAIAQADTDYFPTPSFVQKVFGIAQAALKSPRGVDYSFERGSKVKPIVLKPRLSKLARTSALLDWLKSFPWDCWMFRDCAEQLRLHANKLAFEEEKKPRPDSMCVWHYIDHHTAPHVAYYMSPQALRIANSKYNQREWFGDLNDRKDRPYAKLFRYLFHTCSGVNDVRRKRKVPPDPTFAHYVEEAQSALWLEQYGRELLALDRSSATGSLVLLDEAEEVDYEMNALQLAADIGHILVKVDGVGYYVFVSQLNEACEAVFGAVRVPTRDQKDTVIGAMEREHAIAAGKRILVEQGVKLSAQSCFGARTCVLNQDDGRLYFRKGSQQLAPLEQPRFSLASQTRISVDDLQSRLANVSQACARRLFRLTEGFVTKIELPKITRFGGADNKPVHPIDVDVFRLCQSLSPLFVLEKQRYFRISDPIVWFWAREACLEPLVRRLDGMYDCENWNMTPDREQRTLTQAQTRALNALQTRNAATNVHVMDTGSGKTLVVMTYLLWLLHNKRLPKKVLFVTPESAIDSVKREIECFTPHVVVRSMRKNQRSEEPLADFTITLLSQDHMRLVGDIWDDDLMDTMFVLDEFHLCLDQKTQRTKFMQMFSSGCDQRFALSATPVLNLEIFGIRELLAPLCPFEIKRENFFVAYAHVVQERDTMHFDIIDNTLAVDVSPTNTAYWDLLPANLGGKNTRRLEAADLNTLMDMAQREASEHMIASTLAHLALGNTVFLVAKNKVHVEQLASRLRKLKIDNVYCVQSETDAITLTEKTVCKPSGKYRRWDVVIVPLHCATGYSMTICNVQVSTLYFSNAAKRAQIRGRIKRLGSEWQTLTYEMIECGVIHKLVSNRYNRGDSFNAVLQDVNNPH